MTSVENSSISTRHARIDLFRMTVGANREDKKLEVLAIYLHSLAAFLPVKVINTILKDEFEPEDAKLQLSRRFNSETDRLNSLLLQKVEEASIRPLRSEQYGAPPQHIRWHFFATQDARPLMEVLRKL